MAIVASAGGGRAQAAAPKAPRSIWPWELFRFATAADVALILIGAVLAIGTGVCFPIQGAIFGGFGEATAVVHDNALDAIRPLLARFGILALGIALTSGLWRMAFTLTSERQSASLRKAYLDAVLRQDMSWFDLRKPEELPTRMAAQVTALQEAIGQTGDLVVSLSQFVAGLALAATTGSEGWKITLMTCAPCLLIVMGAAWKAKSVPNALQAKQHNFNRAGSVAEEALGAVRTVASYGGEAAEARRFERHLRPARRAGIRAGLQMGASFGFFVGSFNGMFAVAFWFGVNYTDASATDIFTVLGCFIFAMIGLHRVGQPLVLWTVGMSATAEILQVLREEPEIEPRLGEPAGVEVGNIQEMTFEAVHFCYPAQPNVHVLYGFSLALKRGQKLALVGESGCGKSTVMQLMVRFYDPAGGQITVNGEPLRSLKLSWWRRQIGYVGQEPVLFTASVRDCITNGDATIEEARVVEAARWAHAYDFISALPRQFDTLVSGTQLSGGQKQRIAIARALVRCPQILLLDEATSALDNGSEREVQASIDGLVAEAGGREPGLTIISIAHRLSTVRSSDRIFFMRDGSVVEHGMHEELMAQQGGYFSLVQAQELAAAESSQDEEAGAAAPAGRGSKRKGGKACGSPSPSNGSTLLTSRSARSRSSGDSFAWLESTSAHAAEEEAEEPREEEPRASKEEPKGDAAEPTAQYRPPMGRLLRIVRPEWPLFPVALASCVVAGGAIPAQGMIVSHVVEAFFIYGGSAQKERVTALSLWLLVCAACSCLGEFAKWGLFAYIQESLSLRVRAQSFRALMRQEIGFFDDPASNSAGFSTLLELQAKQVSQLAGLSLGNTLGLAGAILVGLGLALLGSWRVALVVLGLLPFVLACFLMVIREQMTTYRSRSSLCTEAGAILSETILNVRTVRAQQSEQRSLDALGEAADRIAQSAASCRRLLGSGLTFGLADGSIWTIHITAFFYGAWLIDQGVASQSGVFQAFFCVIFGLTGACGAIAFSPDLASGRLAARDIFKLLDRKSKVDTTDPEGTHRSLGDGTVAFEEVRFHYPHRPQLRVLRGLSFRAKPGQTLALVGPSGGGKSTVLQLLQRFYDPSGGRVLVGGTCLTKFDVVWWRQQVAMVGQEPVLFNLSLEDNIRYGKPEATRAEVERVAKSADMDFVFNGKVAWGESLGLKGSRLSAGQKQRVAVARAVLRDPSILLLDEATSALDTNSEREVQRALDAARRGRTTFAIAHRLSTIQDSDSILVVADGALVEQGTHLELMARQGAYYQLARQPVSRGPGADQAGAV